MHIPLVIAILALLALIPLTAVDYFANPDIHVKGLSSYLACIARWIDDPD
jgi:hypothetical protein